MKPTRCDLSRRQFLTHSAGAAAILTCSPTDLLSQAPKSNLPRCGFGVGTFGLVADTVRNVGSGNASDPFTKEKVGTYLFDGVAIGLDRRSFTDRGWQDSQLRMVNNNKQCVYVSMYYALEMNLGDQHQLLIADIDSKYLGLRHRINNYAKTRGKGFSLWAYDSVKTELPVGVQKFYRGTVTGRRSNEAPFSGQPNNVVGWAPGENGEIFIRTDLAAGQSWDLGRSMAEPGIRVVGNTTYFNLTHFIAHEAGHCFGLPHFDNTECVMNATLPGGTCRWDTPQALLDAIAVAAKKIYD